jgi:hypothetical protein
MPTPLPLSLARDRNRGRKREREREKEREREIKKPQRHIFDVHHTPPKTCREGRDKRSTGGA